MSVKQSKCRRCKGDGEINPPGTQDYPIACPACGGTGRATKTVERKAHTALRSTGIVSQRDWKIWLKHARLWKGWKHLVTVYGFDRETAEQKAKECLYYYEGTTKWKVTLANDEASNGRRLVRHSD